MAEIISNVNWLAVIIGTIVSFMLGGLWYSPKLFGTKWAEGVGIDFDPKTAKVPGVALATQFIGTFLLAWIIGITAVNDALLTAVLVIVTAAILLAASGFFTQKSTYAITAESSFVVVMGIIMITCQGIF